MKITDSTQKNIVKFLSKKSPGTTFIYDDFSTCGSYVSIRTAIVNLCKQKLLIRVCQGVFVKPSEDGTKYMPDNFQIVKEIARKCGGSVTFKKIKKKNKNDNSPQMYFYTNNSTRRITLPDKTVVQFYKSNKCSFDYEA